MFEKAGKPGWASIVPIYNVEKYFDRCLTSIVNQTLRNIEIVLVDDESLDMLSRRSKTADVLKLFENRACINHEELKKMVDVSAPTLSHHTGILLEHGLIVRGGGNRKTPTWELTEKGKKVLKRLILEEKYRSKTNRSF